MRGDNTGRGKDLDSRNLWHEDKVVVSRAEGRGHGEFWKGTDMSDFRFGEAETRCYLRLEGEAPPFDLCFLAFVKDFESALDLARTIEVEKDTASKNEFGVLSTRYGGLLFHLKDEAVHRQGASCQIGMIGGGTP